MPRAKALKLVTTWSLLVGAQLFALAPTAQADDPPRLRGSRLPVQKEFLLIQTGILARLDDRDKEAPEALVFDLGGMKNLSPRHALGGTLGLVADTDYTRIAVKPRYRRWLGNTFSLDLAPGVLLPIDSDSGPDHASVGLVGELSLSAGDWVSLTGLVEVVETKRLSGDSSAASTRSETEASYYLGAKAGGEAGIAAAIVIGLLIIGSASSN